MYFIVWESTASGRLWEFKASEMVVALNVTFPKSSGQVWKTDVGAWGPVVSSPHCFILLLYLVLKWIAYNSHFLFTQSFLCLLACSGLSKMDPWKMHAYFECPKRSLFSLLPWWCVWLAPGKSKSKTIFFRSLKTLFYFMLPPSVAVGRLSYSDSWCFLPDLFFFLSP